jgi:hypothetical protein
VRSGAIRDRIVTAARRLGDFATCAIAADEELVIARQFRVVLENEPAADRGSTAAP